VLAHGFELPPRVAKARGMGEAEEVAGLFVERECGVDIYVRLPDGSGIDFLRQVRNFALYFPAVEFLGSLATALVILYCGMFMLRTGQAASGQGSVGTIFAFVFLAERFFGPIRALADRYPDLTYDVTVKVEHLLNHRDLIPVLRETGCLFVTTAVESIEDEVLARLEKGHTRADFIEVVRACREAGLELAPTFIPFSPWTTWAGYRDLLRLLVELDMVDRVAPVQLGLRLLVTTGSRLLELPEIAAAIGEFDQAALIYPWRHADPSLDELSAAVLRLLARDRQSSRRDLFAQIWKLATSDPLPDNYDLLPRAAIPSPPPAPHPSPRAAASR